MALPQTTANVRFEFSRTMAHPTAADPVGAEVWEEAPGFFEGKLHWVLGSDPSWVECWFHAGTDRVFPWTRVKASDELGVISIYRFDQVTEEFSDRGRVWKAYGRCAIYGATDNYLRSPRIYTQTGATDPDNGYEEWPVIGPDQLKSCEEILRLVGDARNGLYVNCLAAPTYPVTGYTFKTDAERDAFLETQVAESAYATTPEKIGPNYVSKGVRRGWVFKDIFRHTAGKHDSASRPVLGVYNRTQKRFGAENEGDVVNSNFQQAQAGGAGANALAHDAAISFPWLAAIEEFQTDTQENINNIIGETTPIAPSDLGYDYRTVWPGKSDSYAKSGQAVELFQRGSEEWDDSVCFSCGERPHLPTEPPCPITVVLTYFQGRVLKHVVLRYFPNQADLCALKPDPESIRIGGMGVIVTVVDTTLANYDLSKPARLLEWFNRLMLRSFPVFATGSDGLPKRTTFGTAGRLGCGSGHGLVRCAEEPGDCFSHLFTVTAGGDSVTGCSCLMALYATPTFPVGISSRGGTCFGTDDPLALTVITAEPTKDSWCYQKDEPDSPCPPGGLPPGEETPPTIITRGKMTLAGSASNTPLDGDARLVKLNAAGKWKQFFAGEKKSLKRLKEFQHPDGTVLHFVMDSAATTPLFFRRGPLYISVGTDAEEWTKVTTLPNNCSDIAMAIGGTLWAIVDEREQGDDFPFNDPQTSRIYKSTDKGDTWALSKTLTEGSHSGRKSQAYSIATHPTDANIIVVAGIETIAGGTRFWRTLNGGANWTFVTPTLVGGGAIPGNLGGASSLFGFNSTGRLAYGGLVSAVPRFLDSTDNGSTWTIRLVVGGGSRIMQYLEKCGVAWWVTEDFIYKSPLDHSSFTLVAQTGAAGLAAADILAGIDCTDTELALGINCQECTGPNPSAHSIFTRPADLSANWVPAAPTMLADLGYKLRIGVAGLKGITTQAELHPQGPGLGLGSKDSLCVAMMNWEVLVDSRGGYYSRSRAFGMGMNNAGGDQTALIPDAETTWNPSSITGCFGGENGPYRVRREIIVNDYGINEGPELGRLANSYLPSEDKSLGGFTTIKFQAGGILRATKNGPHPDKPLQAGDRITLTDTCRLPCNIAPGAWMVDEVEYAFPEGISTITISRRPAAQVGSYPQSNIRTLGESAAGAGQVFESEWFHVLEPRFKAGTINQNESGLYDLFSFDHYLGTIPQSIIIVAAKQKIFNWFDDAAVTAAQPLYVPEGNLFDHTQVQGVGYDVVSVNEQSIHFQFRRYLFYDDIDGRWVYPTERVLKVWIMP